MQSAMGILHDDGDAQGARLRGLRIHGAWTRLAHWASAAAVAVALACPTLGDALDIPGSGKFLAATHMAAGLCAFALCVLRLAIRARARPVAPWPLPAAMRRAGLAVHASIYALLLAVPVLGALRTNAAGRPVGLPGLPAFPPLVGRDRELADLLGVAHEIAAWTLAVAILAHVAAAAWHRFALKDGVAASMLGEWALPGRLRAPLPMTEGPEAK